MAEGAVGQPQERKDEAVDDMTHYMRATAEQKARADQAEAKAEEALSKLDLCASILEVDHRRLGEGCGEDACNLCLIQANVKEARAALVRDEGRE